MQHLERPDVWTAAWREAESSCSDSPSAVLVPRRVVTSVGPNEPPSSLSNLRRTREFLAHQGYELQVFNDREQDRYVELHASELLRRAYNAVLVGAARADIFRYLYLYHEGGIWMDSKTYIGVELDKLVQRKEIVRIKFHGLYQRETIEQWFLAFPPRHPVLSTTLDLVTENILSGRFGELTGFEATPSNSATRSPSST